MSNRGNALFPGPSRGDAISQVVQAKFPAVTCKVGKKRPHPWTAQEDEVLQALVARFGPRNWAKIALHIPARGGKSCRLRWCNQLNPALKKHHFSEWEDAVILKARATHGNKWAVIARLLRGRTDNAIKNHYNSTLRRKVHCETFRNRFLEQGVELKWLLSNRHLDVPEPVEPKRGTGKGGNKGEDGGSRAGDEEEGEEDEEDGEEEQEEEEGSFAEVREGVAESHKMTSHPDPLVSAPLILSHVMSPLSPALSFPPRSINGLVGPSSIPSAPVKPLAKLDDAQDLGDPEISAASSNFTHLSRSYTTTPVEGYETLATSNSPLPANHMQSLHSQLLGVQNSHLNFSTPANFQLDGQSFIGPNNTGTHPRAQPNPGSAIIGSAAFNPDSQILTLQNSMSSNSPRGPLPLSGLDSLAMALDQDGDAFPSGQPKDTQPSPDPRNPPPGPWQRQSPLPTPDPAAAVPLTDASGTSEPSAQPRLESRTGPIAPAAESAPDSHMESGTDLQFSIPQCGSSLGQVSPLPEPGPSNAIDLDTTDDVGGMGNGPLEPLPYVPQCGSSLGQSSLYFLQQHPQTSPDPSSPASLPAASPDAPPAAPPTPEGQNAHPASNTSQHMTEAEEILAQLASNTSDVLPHALVNPGQPCSSLIPEDSGGDPTTITPPPHPTGNPTPILPTGAPQASCDLGSSNFMAGGTQGVPDIPVPNLKPDTAARPALATSDAGAAELALVTQQVTEAHAHAQTQKGTKAGSQACTHLPAHTQVQVKVEAGESDLHCSSWAAVYSEGMAGLDGCSDLLPQRGRRGGNGTGSAQLLPLDCSSLISSHPLSQECADHQLLGGCPGGSPLGLLSQHSHGLSCTSEQTLDMLGLVAHGKEPSIYGFQPSSLEASGISFQHSGGMETSPLTMQHSGGVLSRFDSSHVEAPSLTMQHSDGSHCEAEPSTYTFQPQRKRSFCEGPDVVQYYSNSHPGTPAAKRARLQLTASTTRTNCFDHSYTQQLNPHRAPALLPTELSWEHPSSDSFSHPLGAAMGVSGMCSRFGVELSGQTSNQTLGQISGRDLWNVHTAADIFQAPQQYEPNMDLSGAAGVMQGMGASYPSLSSGHWCNAEGATLDGVLAGASSMSCGTDSGSILRSSSYNAASMPSRWSNSRAVCTQALGNTMLDELMM